MPFSYNADQVAALAPDPASLKAGRGLTNPGKWPMLGLSEEALWGECQGSGSKPYQVSIDLAGPAFKCTCPSRKFPCKHGLGLLFIAVEKRASVPAAEPPAWVADWLSSRKDKAEKKAVAAEKKEQAPVDHEAVAKRAAKRLQRMKEGGEELSRWLADQVRNGISSFPQQPPSYWTGVAARMVDAQVPGLSTEMQRLEDFAHSGDGWPKRALTQLGRMHLLCEGLSRFESLPSALQADLRSSLGWALEKDELLATQPKVEDDWLVLGQTFVERERLWERRTWLLGAQSRRHALVLDFSHGSRNFAVSLLTGSSSRAPLVFYPSGYPLRALWIEGAGEPRTFVPPAGYPGFTAAQESIAQGLAANPWLLSFPMVVENVTPRRTETRWTLRDAEGVECPWRQPDLEAWEISALSGGGPLTVFGEWQYGVLHVLSCWKDGAFHSFTSSTTA